VGRSSGCVTAAATARVETARRSSCPDSQLDDLDRSNDAVQADIAGWAVLGTLLFAAGVTSPATPAPTIAALTRRLALRQASFGLASGIHGGSTDRGTCRWRLWRPESLHRAGDLL
jgi:hypothetical protein